MNDSPRGHGLRLAFAVGLLGSLAGIARADDAIVRVPADARVPASPLFDVTSPFARPPAVQPSRLQRPAPPLDPAYRQRLRRAVDLRLGGLPERSRDSLLALDREVPRHPLIVVELAQTELATGHESDAVSRLRALRESTRDSLAGSHELALAYERTRRPRDAAAIAVESWTATTAEGAWASALLLRLAPIDPRGITQELRQACVRRPERGDMARGLAFLLARQGQPAEAARALATADAFSPRVSLRRLFADEALGTGVATDSLAAREALLSAAGDPALELPLRFDAALRVLGLDAGDDARRPDGAVRLAKALADVPSSRWGPDLVLDISRRLREAGQPAQASALIAGGSAALARHPELALERALDLARTNGPARAIPELDSLARVWMPARFRLAEMQFWAGEIDSALVNYRKTAEATDSPDALAALERTYLIEEDPRAPELRAFGAIAWERWRGDRTRARVLADSLWSTLSRKSPFFAQAALQAHGARAEAGEWSASIEPLAVVADSLPGDRLAPLARQRTGEAYLRLGDARRALAQFEECLVRYPRAWNSPEVRRQVERLRKERRL